MSEQFRFKFKAPEKGAQALVQFTSVCYWCEFVTGLFSEVEMRVEMLKKYSCIFRYDGIELSCCRHKRTCYLQIFPCWGVYSSGSLDHSDCSHLFCILCASVQQIMDLISDINMHITSAFNLKPALTKEIKRLPKVLTGMLTYMFFFFLFKCRSK